MIQIILLIGAPGSGKSTWAKSEIAKDPNSYLRVNNDEIRALANGSVFSPDYEKLISNIRNAIIKEGIAVNKNIIIDNVNSNSKHFQDVCVIAKKANKDITVSEKPFYLELDELLLRNSKREGIARAPDNIVKKFYNQLGGKKFENYQPKIEIFTKQSVMENRNVVPLVQDKALKSALICDLDGTLALIGNRSPYDASNCDIIDVPNEPVIETVLAHYKVGRKIIFCSGREDKYRPETIRFIEKYCQLTVNDTHDRDFVPTVIKYQLHMRKIDDFRNDAIIKEEIFQNEIEGKYNVLLVLDDRNSVVSFWREKGLTCFQVAPGDF